VKIHRRILLLVSLTISLSACYSNEHVKTPDLKTPEIGTLVPVTTLETQVPDEINPSLPVGTMESNTPEVYETSSIQFNAYMCEAEACILEQPFLLKRPIAPGLTNWIDATYPFGDTSAGKYDIHHGVEFINASGTEVLAVGNGVVRAAGDDLKTRYSNWLDFYGNVVIIEHQQNEIPEPIFTVYGHLSEINVSVGQEVQQGQLIGLVGATGYAIGSHLHFEVRFGNDLYNHTVNPVLWLVPRVSDSDGVLGNLSGQLINRWGELVKGKQITIEALQKDGLGRMRRYFINTYADVDLSRVSPYHENFSLADLPAGKYRISIVNGKLFESTVTIIPGQTTYITLRVP
jgi:hypothetical protein